MGSQILFHQSKAKISVTFAWPLALACCEERKGFVSGSRSSYSLSEPGIEGVSFSRALAEGGDSCRRSNMTLEKSATEVQSLESKELYHSRYSSYLDTFLKQQILRCCKSLHLWQCYLQILNFLNSSHRAKTSLRTHPLLTFKDTECQTLMATQELWEIIVWQYVFSNCFEVAAVLWNWFYFSCFDIFFLCNVQKATKKGQFTNYSPFC